MVFITIIKGMTLIEDFLIGLRTLAHLLIWADSFYGSYAYPHPSWFVG
jgi:hypothetical protein